MIGGFLFIIEFLICCSGICSAFFGYKNLVKGIVIKGLLQFLLSVVLLALAVVVVMNMNL